MAAIQAWNDAGTGAPRLAYGGLAKGFVLRETEVDPARQLVLAPPFSVHIVAGNDALMKGAGGQTSAFIGATDPPGTGDEEGVLDAPGVGYGKLRWRLALSIDNNFVRDPVPGAGGDVQALLVHEFGHVLGLRHPWLAAEFDVASNGVRDSFCGLANTPGFASDVDPGATVGVMHYVSRLEAILGTGLNQGTQRYPWRDDIETARLIHGELAVAGPCRSNEDCTECPDDAPNCHPADLVCMLLRRPDTDGDGAVDFAVDADELEAPSCLSDADCGFSDEANKYSPEYCERGVSGVFAGDTDLNPGFCTQDADCNDPKPGVPPTKFCDAQSGACVDLFGTCRSRQCVVASPRSYVIATSEGTAFEEPAWVRQSGGAFTSSIFPPGLSSAPDLVGRRVGLATVDTRSFVRHVDALDGAWCSEVPDAPIDPNPQTGRTWSRPAVAIELACTRPKAVGIRRGSGSLR